MRARARCGSCASAVDLTSLRPYRIVAIAAPRPEELARAREHLPFGLDEPRLATTIVANVAHTPPGPLVPIVMAAGAWDESDPLPEIPEMLGTAPAFERSAPGPGEAIDSRAEDDLDLATRGDPSEAGVSAAVFAFWAAGGAIVGTGTSWTLGGTTAMGVGLGGLVGLAAAWGWLRWTSRP